MKHVLVAFGALGAFAAHAPRAEACSIEPLPAALVGYPEDGATDVPTDVIPFYDRNRTYLPDILEYGHRFVLTSEHGDVVAVSAIPEYYWALTVTPEHELEPNTTYTLEATLLQPGGMSDVVETLVFTTGAGRAAPPAPVEGAFLQHFRLVGSKFGNSCSPGEHGTCVAIPPGATVIANYVDSFRQEQPDGYLWQSSALIDLSGIDQGTNFLCIRLRTRAANGSLSDPVELCGKDAPLYDLDDSVSLNYLDVTCDSTGLSVKGRPVTDPPPTDSTNGTAGRTVVTHGGLCSVGAPGARGSSAWTTLLALLTLVRRKSGAKLRRD